MFELPDAKRVRREDLYDSGSDREDEETLNEDEAELRAKLNAKLSSLLAISLDIPPLSTASGCGGGGGGGGGGGDVSMTDADAEGEPSTTSHSQEEQALTSSSSSSGAQTQAQTKAEAEEAEFSFRLFSTSTPNQKIVLPAKEDEGLTTTASGEDIPFRPRPISHYIKPSLTPQEKHQFQLAAISAQDVLKMASQRAWGFEVPWRVTKITVIGKKAGQQQPVVGTAVDLAEIERQERKKKTRPGKKRRIVLRVREKKQKVEMEKKKAVLDKKKSQLMTKEEHLKEKKKRLNREKKLKRRQKEKEKKAASGGGLGSSVVGDGDDGKSDAGSDGSA